MIQLLETQLMKLYEFHAMTIANRNKAFAAGKNDNGLLVLIGGALPVMVVRKRYGRFEYCGLTNNNPDLYTGNWYVFPAKNYAVFAI